MDLLPLSVSVLILRKDGRLLGVARREDRTDFGLPGGKVETVLPESPEESARRELREETGLWPQHVVPIFSGICTGGEQRFFNIAYVAKFLHDLHGEQKPRQPEGEGRVAWIPPELLLFGSFADYNCELLMYLGILSPEALPTPHPVTHYQRRFEDLLNRVEDVE